MLNNDQDGDDIIVNDDSAHEDDDQDAGKTVEELEAQLKAKEAEVSKLSRMLKRKDNKNTLKTPDATPVVKPEDIRKQIQDEFENRDLGELEYSDPIKAEIKKIATLQNISVRKAAKDPYVAFLLEKESQQRAIDEAAENGANKGKLGRKISIDPSKPLDSSQFDLSTEEGRKQWDEAKAAKRKK